MAAKVSKADVLNRLEMRYDFQSARNVLANWRKLAGIKDDPNDYDDKQVAALADYLEGLGDAASDVANLLRGGPAPAKAEPPKDDSKKDDKKDDSKKDDSKKDDKKDDSKKDDSKKDDKKDDKGKGKKKK